MFLRLNADGTHDVTLDAFTVANPSFSTHIISITEQPDGKLVVVANQAGIEGSSGTIILRLTTNGSVDWTFQAGNGPNSSVFSAVCQSDGKLIIGGYFTEVQGMPAVGLARLHLDGTFDPNFNAGTGASFVTAVAASHDGGLVVGGFFSQVDGAMRRGVAKLDRDGAVTVGFDPGLGIAKQGGPGSVDSFAVHPDGSVFVGGDFTSADEVGRVNMAKLGPDGRADAEFDPGSCINGRVMAMAVQSDGRVLIGGGALPKWMALRAAVWPAWASMARWTRHSKFTLVPPTL